MWSGVSVEFQGTRIFSKSASRLNVFCCFLFLTLARRDNYWMKKEQRSLSPSTEVRRIYTSPYANAIWLKVLREWRKDGGRTQRIWILEDRLFWVVNMYTYRIYH